ncbi:hypothetical protein [Desulfocurvus vexinensis]|uniref:hypothetical protein n=1 Tax=Desulfocurvus vexinensis TaxID=399548 RepID=UPI0012EC5AB7|nr:hypothetical protein [Desulfocurvus vexinensis]
MDDTTMLIHFPELLPSSRCEAVPGVRHLDPGFPAGLAPEVGYLPPGLPLDARAAARWLAQATGYAGLFAPGALRAAEAAAKAPGADPYGDPTRVIVGELAALEGLGPAPQGAAPGADTSRLRAQAVLLLACERERALAEVRTLGAAHGGAVERLGATLGLEPEDMDELAAAGGLALDDGEEPAYAEPAQWQPVLGAMLRLLPPQAVLYADAAPVVEAWREAGVPLAPVAGAELARLLPGAPAGGWLLARCPGYVLMGATRPLAEAPWLDGERTVLARAAGAGQ